MIRCKKEKYEIGDMVGRYSTYFKKWIDQGIIVETLGDSNYEVLWFKKNEKKLAHSSTFWYIDAESKKG